MLLNTAKEYFEQSRYEEAITCLDRFIDGEPGNTEAVHLRGWSNLKLARYERALTDFNIALNTTPDDAGLLERRAVALFFTGSKNEAMQSLDKAIALEPLNDYRYACRAYFKSRLGDLTGAIADYEKALELDPLNAVTENNLIMVQEALSRQGGKAYIPQSPESISIQNDSANSITNIQANYISVLKTTLTSWVGFKDFLFFVKELFYR